MTAYLYWYPDPGAGMVRTDLLHGLERLPYRLDPRGSGVLTEGGQVVPGRRGGVTRLETQITIDTPDLAATLRTAEAAILGGAVWGLSADHTRTWAAHTAAPIQRGQTVIPVESPAVSSIYSPSGAVSAGDYVVIESGHPHHDYEEARVASVSSGSITLASGCLRSHPAPALVRWREFHPWLTAEPGSHRPWLVDVVPGVVWRLELRAVEAIQSASRSRILAQLASGPGVGIRNDQPDGKGQPGDLLGAVRDEREEQPPSRRAPGLLGGRTRGGGKGVI